MYKAIRYIGSKQKVLPFLNDHLFNQLKGGNTFFEAFAGTGIISQFLVETKSIIPSGGDISSYSKSLYMILNFRLAFPNINNFWNIINHLIQLPKKPGVFTQEFSGAGLPKTFNSPRNFFHPLAAETIDTIRDYLIQDKNLTPMQKEVLLFFLLAYSCKVANTTSVFGAYLKSPPKYTPFSIAFCQTIVSAIQSLEPLKEAVFYQGDVISNLNAIPHQNMIYMDPPYSTRKYESNYHILNYVADLNFNISMIKPQSKTALPITQPANLFGSKKGTEQIFSQMIKKGVEKSDLLAISYNTDGLITEDWMVKFCQEQHLVLNVHKMAYKRFKSNTNAVNTGQLEEILWLIRK